MNRVIMMKSSKGKSGMDDSADKVAYNGVIGIILAAGKGDRLRPITEKIPKPLIEINDGYTIMDKQLMEFKNAGIDNVVIPIAYLGEYFLLYAAYEWAAYSQTCLLEGSSHARQHSTKTH